MKNVKAYFQYLLFVDRRQPVITLGDRDYTGSDALLDERIKTRRQLYAFRLFYLVVVVSLMIYVFHLSSFAAILSLIPAELIFLVFKMPAAYSCFLISCSQKLPFIFEAASLHKASFNFFIFHSLLLEFI